MDIRTTPVPAQNAVLADGPYIAASPAPFRALDHAKEASIARMTAGLSPTALALAVADWRIHVAAAPGKQLELASLALLNARRVADYMAHAFLGLYAASLVEPSRGDDRFHADVWQTGALSALATDVSFRRTMVEHRHPRRAGHNASP